MHLLIFLVSLFTCSPIYNFVSGLKTYDQYKLVKLIPKTPNALQALRNLEKSTETGFDFWSAVSHIGEPVDVMVSPEKFCDLEKLIEEHDMDLDLLMDDVESHIQVEKISQVRRSGFGWTQYHTLGEINAWLRNLTKTYPFIVTLIELNRTHEGRSLTGVKVAFGGRRIKKAVFVESNIHAREWITSATSTYILNELLTSNDTSIKKLARYYDWYFFPLFNPDGFAFTHSEDRMWRKTRVPYTIYPPCFGADPNRNWEYNWNQGGTSQDPCTDLYHGPKPFSEPCAAVMSEFIRTIGRDLVAYISFHSFMQLMVIPYGHTEQHLGNYDQTYRIGVRAAKALAKRYGTRYKVGTVVDVVYVASGSSTDWVKGTFNTPLVYTYELRDTGRYGFLLPPEQIKPTAQETFDSFVTIFKEYYKETTKEDF